MEVNDLLSDLLFELDDLGYRQKLEIQENQFYFMPKSLVLKPSDLFFIDAAFIIEEEFVVLAINSPLFSIKGTLTTSKADYNSLRTNGYESMFALFSLKSYDESVSGIKIERQYNMRKITKNDFDPMRYELRKEFPDFPPCPYGHTFNGLGYDSEMNEYVRFTSSILKDERLKTIKYKA